MAKKHVHPALPRNVGTSGILLVAAIVTGLLVLLPWSIRIGNALFSSSSFDHRHPVPIMWAAAGLSIPVAVFCALDACCTSSHWACVGPLRKFPSDTSDPARRGRFVLRWRNAHSSNSLIA